MCFHVKKAAVDYSYTLDCVIQTKSPVFTWQAEHIDPRAMQGAYRIVVTRGRETAWDSGWQSGAEQRTVYAGEPLMSVTRYFWSVQLRDNSGRESDVYQSAFLTPKFEAWEACWITSVQDSVGEAKYFFKDFSVQAKVAEAFLLVSGIGMQSVFVNGKAADDSVFQPAVTNYKKRCLYTILPAEKLLCEGENRIGVIVGEGWRRNEGKYLHVLKREVEFFGVPSLTAELNIVYEDGRVQCVRTDETWYCGSGAIVFNHLFDGETYDETRENPGWNKPGFFGGSFCPAKEISSVTEQMEPQTIPPEKEHTRLKPIQKYRVGDGRYLFDFGVNIAGYVEMRIPADMPSGSSITITHAENVMPNGELDCKTLRAAAARDVYIKGEKQGEFWWKPIFTYHGFRYISVEGYPHIPSEADFRAVCVYNALDTGSFFKCGSGVANQIQENILRTERNNLHGIAADCPQRDERMGWMNDATVRFEEMPYNFDMGRMFPKIIDDIVAEQGEDGSITCTAPRVYGERPADPVCSSFLVAGLECLNFYGQIETIKKYYAHFKAWNECLRSHSKNGIVDYSYYGDWAGPADYCDKPENGAKSIVTPGRLLSTGYHYYNYKLLEKFALILEDEEEVKYNAEQAERVRKAFLKKWWHGRTGFVDRGSQGSQAFALWLGILPENKVKLAAQRLHEAVENVGYRLTTGNLTTRYVMDMLAKHGYINDAWKIMTREKYPSWGYMIQNGATTIWERFELKRFSTMNSHNHPMYGAVGYWFYSYIAGIKPLSPGFREFEVAPHLPDDLLYAEAKVDTVSGEIYVKWEKKFGCLNLYVDVPFNCTAVIRINNQVVRREGGLHCLSFEQ